MRGEKSSTSYVTRLQCAIASIDLHLNRLKTLKPKTKVMVVTFNNEISILSPSNDQQDIILSGDFLETSLEKLIERGKQHDSQLIPSISQSFGVLSNKVKSLKETGSTALGNFKYFINLFLFIYFIYFYFYFIILFFYFYFFSFIFLLFI